MITEGDRQLVDQNKKAGDLIATKATEPEIKQAGKDVHDNSVRLEQVIGVPVEATQPYSPAASATIRTASEKEHEQANDLWKMALGAIAAKIPYGGAIVGVLVGLNEWLKRRKAQAATYAVVQGVSELPAVLAGTADAAKQKDLGATIKGVMETYAKANGVYHQLDTMIGKWKAQSKITKLGAA
jgi:hypothetical protein